MRIFEIKSQGNDMQSLNFVDYNSSTSDLLEFQCKPELKRWENLNPLFYITTPEEKVNDFFHLIIGSLAFNQKVNDICSDVFNKAGEILPLRVKDMLYALNVLNCNDCIDRENSVYDYYDDGTRGRILKFRFKKEMISLTSSIFKAQKKANGEIYCFADVLPQEQEFYYVYQDKGLTGLKFEEIFSFEL